MPFNSFAFFIFFLVILLFYLVLSYRKQNYLLLFGSYFFYAAWDVRFLGLLGLTTLIDYAAARGMTAANQDSRRKILLTASLTANLGILCLFKYFNFFAQGFFDSLRFFGLTASPFTLKIILPVGISFYIFKSISYSIDVYRKQIPACKNLSDYALYVSFFPQLLAGPIERATRFIPQITQGRTITWDNIRKGIYLVFWGLFLKVFIADNLALLVDPIFQQKQADGLTYILAGYAFTFQIYGDFAGYSYISQGLALLLGFETMDNFHLPYLSASPQEFWHRWHISLSTWLRDYLYIPLGGNRQGEFRTQCNLMITMLLGGLWHGANWTYVIWGAYHGLLLTVQRLMTQPGRKKTVESMQKPERLIRLMKIILCFHAVVLGWIIFRAESISQVVTIFRSLFVDFNPDGILHRDLVLKLAFYITPLCFIQFLQFWKNDLLAVLRFSVPVRTMIYVIVFYLTVIFGVYGTQNFIYFQF